jgi:hypothetical protein
MIIGLISLLFLIVIALYANYCLTISRIQLRLLQDAIAATNCPLTSAEVTTLCRESEAQARAIYNAMKEAA